MCDPVAANLVTEIKQLNAELLDGQPYELLLVGAGSKLLPIRDLLSKFHSGSLHPSVPSYAEEAAAYGAAGSGSLC